MNELPACIQTLVDAARSASFRVERGRQQVMIRCAGQDGRWVKVGGWNNRKEHWYVSKRLAVVHDDLLERLGFRWMVMGGGQHCW